LYTKITENVIINVQSISISIEMLLSNHFVVYSKPQKTIWDFIFFFLKSDTWAINNLDSSEIFNIHHNEFIDSKRLHLNCLSISASNIQMSFVEINFIKAFECDEKLQCKNFYEGLLMVDIWVLWDRNLVAFRRMTCKIVTD